MARRFEDKTALVTGGSRGIGKATAERLVKEGAKVYAIGRSKENLEKLKADNPSIITIQVDISDWDKTKASVEQIGIVDLLVNNAGLGRREYFVDEKKGKFEDIVDTNFKSAFNVTQTVARGMIVSGRRGAVVNVSSVLGIKPVLPGFTSYCISKAMMDMLTKLTALELGPHGIRVNSINPTLIPTDMAKQYYEDEEFIQMFSNQHPLGKCATLEDAVNATIFLLSEDSAMITGSVLAIDGGLLQY
ncbi:hypothetical protein KUTeg_016581 [Tegillarca granosa]|uniref:Uncharacterized protein n=1 Tax=Tegillarca granosa TaxID=220873 RepID=A0ABQ9ELA5_TEGGR|nr:hypothetical protein KUTeg_016581 [Tegillarca granosa]